MQRIDRGERCIAEIIEDRLAVRCKIFDPERARELLAQAGYPDGASFPEVDMLTPKFPLFPGKIAQALQSFWAQHLDIRVNWKVLDTSDFYNLNQQSALWITGWVADYPDPDTFMRVGVRAYARFWQHPDYDRLIEEATRTGDPAERLWLYRQADRILMEEAAIVPIVHLFRNQLVKPWVKTIEPGSWDARDIIIEPH
jgi:oligopeptide transport system substrate-binding protein